jgi:lactoylglutathione lyase
MSAHVTAIELILYVADQGRSRDFYALVLVQPPVLDVPGMTAFDLGNGCKLGLMPEQGIAKIITPVLPHPREAQGVPRCELYLRVSDVQAYDARAQVAGATLVDAGKPRDWGDHVSYWADPDGHVLAFAMGV